MLHTQPFTIRIHDFGILKKHFRVLLETTKKRFCVQFRNEKSQISGSPGTLFRALFDTIFGHLRLETVDFSGPNRRLVPPKSAVSKRE